MYFENGRISSVFGVAIIKRAEDWLCRLSPDRKSLYSRHVRPPIISFVLHCPRAAILNACKVKKTAVIASLVCIITLIIIELRKPAREESLIERYYYFSFIVSLIAVSLIVNLFPCSARIIDCVLFFYESHGWAKNRVLRKAVAINYVMLNQFALS